MINDYLIENSAAKVSKKKRSSKQMAFFLYDREG